tara:strand:+ start:192 stop:830 length:639 start_codon:yes stop_codon:yes gene_type:complete
MKKISLIILSIFILINNLVFLNLYSEIKNNIVVKVGESLVTSIDIQNEIITKLIINRQEITQENINSSKNNAVKKLVNKLIKKNEIKKYEIVNYNKKDLENYVDKVAKNLNTNIIGLKKIFNQTGINYEYFVENHRVELLWNTLIFKIYRDQINVNIIDVENEIEKIRVNNNNVDLEKAKKNILDQKKGEKLNLFSRSHFSNLERTTVINFQ